MRARFVSFLALGLLAPLGACETTFLSVSSDGRLEIVVSSSGDDPDSDGFTVFIDGVGHTVPAAGTITLSNLSPGTHRLELAGVSENCSVRGDNPRTVAVGSDGTASVRFDVRCALARPAVS